MCTPCFNSESHTHNSSVTFPISHVHDSCIVRGANLQLFFFCKLMVLHVSVKVSVFDFSIKVYYPKWAVSQIALIRNSKLHVHQEIDLEWLMMLQSCQPLFIRKISSVISQEFISSFLFPQNLLKCGLSLLLAYTKAFPLHYYPPLWAYTHAHTHTHRVLLFTLTFKAPNQPYPSLPFSHQHPHYHHYTDVQTTSHSCCALNRFSMHHFPSLPIWRPLAHICTHQSSTNYSVPCWDLPFLGGLSCLPNRINLLLVGSFFQLCLHHSYNTAPAYIFYNYPGIYLLFQQNMNPGRQKHVIFTVASQAMPSIW